MSQRGSGRKRRARESTQPDTQENGTTGGFSALTDDQQEELVRRVVRYMLARNARKRPVRRNDLSKFVLSSLPEGGKGRVFNAAFERGRTELEKTFGVRVVEVFRPVKSSAGSATRRTQTQTQTQAGGVAGMTKAYIVVSSLPQKLRAENRRAHPLYGLLMMIASIIALTPECRIEEGALYRALERLGIFVRENNGHKELNGGNVKELMEKTLVEQWYLDKEKDGDEMFWKIGPRLWAELDLGDIIMFVEAVYKEGGSETSGIDEVAHADLKRKMESAMGECLGVAADEE